jgi:hypothetical protein
MPSSIVPTTASNGKHYPVISPYNRVWVLSIGFCRKDFKVTNELVSFVLF